MAGEDMAGQVTGWLDLVKEAIVPLCTLLAAAVGACGQYLLAKANAFNAEKLQHFKRVNTSFEDVGNKLAEAREAYMNALADGPVNSAESQEGPVLKPEAFLGIKNLLFSAKDRNARYLPKDLRMALDELAGISYGLIDGQCALPDGEFVVLKDDIDALFAKAQDALADGCPKPGKPVE